ncbi:unnamed protein product [Schistosoma turkestanicum]|nr:unnamed protein product [Schistosoma turkestanicum]
MNSHLFKQYPCIQLSRDIKKLIQQSDYILAGRLRNHDQNQNAYDTSHNNNNNKYFNITVLIKIIYKTSYPIENNLITIGPIFIPDDHHQLGTGCLTAFYPNAKYIFFLRKHDKLTNYYEPLSEVMEFNEQMEKQIYAYYCHNCVKPKIESIPNQVLEYGFTLTVSCLATGKPTPNIMWIRDGKSVNLADKGLTVETFERSPGHVESILEINSLILIDSGEYWCYAENALGLTKEKFILKVEQNNRTDEKVMVDELIPCSNEDKDYCLNGGQCYTSKNERVSFQCRCIDHYFGDRCHFHTDGLYGIHIFSGAFSESRENHLQSLLHEIIRTLTLRGIFFTLFGISIHILIFYGIWKCQQRSMHRKYLRKRNKSAFKNGSQTKTTHSMNKSNSGQRILTTVNNNNTDSFLMNDFHERNVNMDTVPIVENYHGPTANSFILPVTNLFTTGNYENHSQNCTGGDVAIDLKLPLSTSHVNPQPLLHDQSRNPPQIGYRSSTSLDQCNENGINLYNRPFGTDWSTQRLLTSQKCGSIRDRLPVLAEGSNSDLNIDRCLDYTNPMNRMNRFDHDREMTMNMISSTSSFIQTNT